MKMNSTYGYILLEKAVFNLDTFYQKNKEKIEDVYSLNKDEDFGISFELDDHCNIVCAFSIFGSTLLNVEMNFVCFIEKLKATFPDYKILVKIELIQDNETNEVFFNGSIPDIFLNEGKENIFS